jgi:hypothetical protein
MGMLTIWFAVPTTFALVNAALVAGYLWFLRLSRLEASTERT